MTHDNIYMVNFAATAVPANANIPLGNIVRRYGCACNGTSNAVTLKECGYYQVDFNITYTGAAGAAAEGTGGEAGADRSAGLCTG